MVGAFSFWAGAETGFASGTGSLPATASENSRPTESAPSPRRLSRSAPAALQPGPLGGDDGTEFGAHAAELGPGPLHPLPLRHRPVGGVVAPRHEARGPAPPASIRGQPLQRPHAPLIRPVRELVQVFVAGAER